MTHSVELRILTITCLTITACLRASSSGTNDYVSSFKAFVNAQHAEYEVQFSVVQYADDELKRRVEAFNSGSAKRKLSLSYDRPQFYRVRRARGGFAVRRGSNLSEVLDRDSLEFGVVSNTFWSVDRQAVTFDDAALRKLKATQGKDWTNLADEAVQEVMTLGMWVRGGSVVWDGDAFTAETPECNPIPRDRRGKRIVFGQLFCSNGIPALVNYGYDSNRYSVYYSYDRNDHQTIKLPRTMDVVEVYLASGMTNRCSLELISYKATNFALASTGPGPRKDELPVLHRSAGGAVEWTGLKGKGTKPATVSVKQEVHTAVRRGVLVGAMVIFTVLFIGGLFWQKVARP